MPVDRARQGDLFGGIGGLARLDRGGEQLVGVAADRVQVELALFRAGDGVEVIDQPSQAGRFGLQDRQDRVVGGDDPIGDPLKVAVDGGQRGAQLMGQVGEQIGLVMRRASRKLTPSAVATATPVPVPSATMIALARPSSRWRAVSGGTTPSAMRTWVWNTPGATASAIKIGRASCRERV